VNGDQSLRVGNQFEIQTEVYTGPLDLLIDLIERRKLLVNDISLASVTDDYMKYVAALEERPLRDIADFIVLAATLLLLKSKSLLPILELTEAEEESVEALETRLKYYQIFRTVGQKIAGMFGKNPSYDRPYVQDRTPMFLPDRYTETMALKQAILNVIANLPKKVEKPKVQVRKVVSLEETILNLKNRIERQFSLKFKEFTGDAQERTVVIVGFLAVLEMVKQGMVMVTQQDRFDEIHIERTGSSAPRYFS
jgi:segregation and condensation protein A